MLENPGSAYDSHSFYYFLALEEAMTATNFDSRSNNPSRLSNELTTQPPRQLFVARICVCSKNRVCSKNFH